MRGYKEPGFQERVANAKQARTKALEALKNKPPIDEAELARRIARQEAKDAAAAKKREATRAAAEAAKLERAQKAAIPVKKPLTEAELKARRDARYAARKKRKK